MKQLEFSFAQPYIEAQLQRLENKRQSWRNFADLCNRIAPQGFDLSKIFDTCNLDKPFDGPSFPVTLVLGYRDQSEFSFVIPIDRSTWDVSMPIKYHYSLDKDKMCQ